MTDLEPLLKQGFFAILLTVEAGIILGILCFISHEIIVFCRIMKHLLKSDNHEHIKQFLR